MNEHVGSVPISDSEEYCHNEVFNAVCAENEVVIIQEAFYGRMDLGRCVTTDFGFIGCKSDVLNVGTISRCILLRTTIGLVIVY